MPGRRVDRRDVQGQIFPRSSEEDIATKSMQHVAVANWTIGRASSFVLRVLFEE